MFDCPDNMAVYTSELTKTMEWSVPEFIDPNNETLEVFANYPQAKWTFPWGDFNVSYSALKLSNGLRTECLFEIRVRRKYTDFDECCFFFITYIPKVYFIAKVHTI